MDTGRLINAAARTAGIKRKQKSAEGRLLELPAQVSRMKFNITPIGTPCASGIGGMISALRPNFLDLPVPRDGIIR